VQCDIDILGEASNLAEIELIIATATTLTKLGFRGFKVRINDRQILKAMAEHSGFQKEDFDTVFIILDKMDKIGMDGVYKELLGSGFSETQVQTYVDLFKGLEVAQMIPLDYLANGLTNCFKPRRISGIKGNYETVSVLSTVEGGFEVLFDPTLVRGMSYYTGTIFEIEMPEFGSSVAGGGRYDEMIGKFTGNQLRLVVFPLDLKELLRFY
jgi:histidyl-tRNA synthetase